MKVYRIENAEGKGPWSSSPHVQAIVRDVYGFSESASRLCPGNMPSPYARGEDAVKDHHTELTNRGHKAHALFAFPNMRMLRRWFRPKLLRAMGEYGFVINVYEVRDFSASYHQVVFDRRSATLIGTKAL